MAGFMKTLIRLPEDRMYELRARAAREGKTLVGVVREAVDFYLGRTEAAEAHALVTDTADPFDAFIGSVDSGDKDGAVNHDHYLYGWPREEANPAPVRGRKRPHRARRSK
jgi:hypothetical protein